MRRYERAALITGSAALVAVAFTCNGDFVLYAFRAALILLVMLHIVFA